MRPDAAAYQRLAQREARDVSQTQDGAAEAESRRFLRSDDYWRKAVLELVGCGVARGALAVLQRAGGPVLLRVPARAAGRYTWATL